MSEMNEKVEEPQEQAADRPALRDVSPNELKEILEAHRKWVESEGKEGERADLLSANLQGANLLSANLQGAYLHTANLQKAYLGGANLYEANLYRANLYEANLYRANLQEANLYGANLQGAYLHTANLQKADLHGANLQGANLDGANLQGADLTPKTAIHQTYVISGRCIGMPLEAAVRSGMNETSTMQPPATSAPICLVFITHLSFLESPPLQLPPHRLDLLSLTASRRSPSFPFPFRPASS